MVGGYEIYKFLFPYPTYNLRNQVIAYKGVVKLYTVHHWTSHPTDIPSHMHEIGTMFELSKSFVQRILSNYSTTFLIYLFKMRRWIYMLIVFHKAGDRKSHGVRFEAVSAAPVLFWMKNNIREKMHWISQWYSGNNHFDVYQIKTS